MSDHKLHCSNIAIRSVETIGTRLEILKSCEGYTIKMPRFTGNRIFNEHTIKNCISKKLREDATRT